MVDIYQFKLKYLIIYIFEGILKHILKQKYPKIKIKGYLIMKVYKKRKVKNYKYNIRRGGKNS
ncbi:hypothetical protein C7M60_01535 [Clostridium botulinum]|nr:hypothetical protein C7M60_01535 [Clostridium botulinum]AVQ48085.1 hypothetical protein C7M58_01530 [Clostridium botulinum]